MKSTPFVILIAILLYACAGTTVLPTPAITATPNATVAPTQIVTPVPHTTLPATTTLAPTNTSAPSSTTRSTETPAFTETTPPSATPAPLNTPAPTSSTGVSSPRFVNHAPPALTLDWSAFENAACCEPTSELGALGCDELSKLSDLLAALEPKIPIALCFVQPYQHQDHQEPPPGSYLYRQGGLLGEYARLVIRRNEKFEIIHSVEELQKVFAPIYSPEEALAYTLAATGFFAGYGFRQEPEFVYLADTIEDTFAIRERDGYLVHLFYYQLFGCGPHETIATDFHITPDGSIQHVASQPVFKDPNMDDLCVD